jgi:ubiquitin-like modifier-activating enzyme ATG7
MQYAPYASDIELPFYTALASHKINHDKLNDSARSVLGLYEIRSTDADNASCRIQIYGNALVNTEYVACDTSTIDFLPANPTGARRAPASYYRAEGMIKNVNTIEDYRNMDKQQMILQAGRTVRFC